jgi:hypothetical protein
MHQNRLPHLLTADAQTKIRTRLVPANPSNFSRIHPTWIKLRPVNEAVSSKSRACLQNQNGTAGAGFRGWSRAAGPPAAKNGPARRVVGFRSRFRSVLKKVPPVCFLPHNSAVFILKTRPIRSSRAPTHAEPRAIVSAGHSSYWSHSSHNRVSQLSRISYV